MLKLYIIIRPVAAAGVMAQKQFFGSLNRKTALYVLASATAVVWCRKTNVATRTVISERAAYAPRTVLQGQLAIRRSYTGAAVVETVFSLFFDSALCAHLHHGACRVYLVLSENDIIATQSRNGFRSEGSR